MKKFLFGLMAVFILSLWTVRPLFHAGFFPMHDDTQVGRVVVMGKALREGQFPVRWVTDLGYGYGYPIFNFYGPLPYYIGGFFSMLGVSGLLATKIMFGIGAVGAGLAMYALLFSIFGMMPAIVGALLYMYAPYHAVQMYVRGAVGELWALMFFPLIVMGFLYSTSRRRWALLIGGLGVAGTILSHTIMGYVVVGMLLMCAVVATMWKKEIARSTWSVFGIGLGLSCFFWLPAVFEMGYTNVAGQIGKTADFRDHFVCFSQLWNSPWGFAGSAPGCVADGMSFMIGKLHIVAGLVGLVTMRVVRTKDVPQKALSIIGIGITGVSILSMLSISRIVWEIVPKSAFIQYPWRFLAFLIFGISLLGATAVAHMPKIVRIGVSVLAICGILFMNAKWFVPKEFYNRDAALFETREALRFDVSKISDEYRVPNMPKPTNFTSLPHDPIHMEEQGLLEREIETDVYKKYFVTSGRPQQIIIQTMMFPGWRYYLNGDEISAVRFNGLPGIMVPQGRSAVELRFGNTLVRAIGNVVSLCMLGALVFFYGKQHKKINT